MLEIAWWAMLFALVFLAVTYALRAALVADSHERKRFREFADKVEDWVRGAGDGNP